MSGCEDAWYQDLADATSWYFDTPEFDPYGGEGFSAYRLVTRFQSWIEPTVNERERYLDELCAEAVVELFARHYA